eukprot:g6635.t1
MSLDSPIVFGFSRSFNEQYEVGPVLGKGGFGVVEQVTRKQTGEVFASKKICKTLTSNVVTPSQQMRHLENVKREIAVLRTLRGSLNIVTLESVFEDEQFVYIIMECCFGGELLHTIGLRPYSESTVVRIMRAVLRTLAQCHERNILHRDVKPGNFMFLKADPSSPIKAVDFGLAVFCDGPNVPRTDLGFDGTPWFMAPEVLSSQVVAASDVWSAGVMAYQLLSGILPFDDKKCRHAPALSAVWKSVLSDAPDFNRKCWNEVSSEAQDFIHVILQKNPKLRPTALQALQHPWFSKERKDRGRRNLSHTIVQRIQRFGQSSLFKRTVLDMIANELLQSYVEKTNYNAKRLGESRLKHMEPSISSCVQRGGGSEYSQSKAIEILNSFQHQDWQEARRASRLSLDTSSHGSDALGHVLDNTNISPRETSGSNNGGPSTKDLSGTRSAIDIAHKLQSVIEQEPREEGIEEEVGRRGKSLYKDYMQSQGLLLQPSMSIEETEPAPMPHLFDQRSIRIEQFMRSVFGVQDAEEVRKVMEFLNIGISSNASEKELISGLGKLGYDVDDHEISCLLNIVSPGGNGVNFTQFVASQIDWEAVKESHKETWLECVKHAFQAMDKDRDGRLSSNDLIEAIGEKLPDKDDIDSALDQARAEACAAELNMNFEEFLTLLNENPSASPLTRFDSRYLSTSSMEL